MKKSELIDRINDMPLDLMHNAVTVIMHSNPHNAITQNRAYYREYCGQIVEIRFTTRATKENIGNVYHAIMDEIAVHYGIETVHREINPDYMPAWYTEHDAQPAQDAGTETETENQTDAENAVESAQEDETTMNENNEIRTASKTTFPHLRAAYIAERETQEENTMFYICNGYMKTWAEEHHTDPDRGIKAHATAHTWDQYQRGEIDRKTAEHRALKRYAKEAEKERAKGLAKLDRVASAQNVDYIDITVNWKRSAYWGYNPTANANIRTEYNGGDVPAFAYDEYTGSASGCGYDKRSAAVAAALNQSDSVLKILYTAAENALAAGARPSKKGLANGCVTWRDIIGYGSGYSITPYFEGGVGVSCFWSILDKCGYTTHSNERGKHTDYYYISRKEG